MIRKSVLCLAVLLLLLVVLAATGAEGSRGGRRRRDSRVHDDHPEDRKEDDDEKDDEEEDDDDDDDHHSGRQSKRRSKRGDSKYDHESFLGRDESRKFDEMSPEEAKKKLVELFGKIDANNDTKISEPEMEAWLAAIAHNDRVRHVEARFLSIKSAINDTNQNSPLSFEDWKNAMHHEVVGDDHGDNETMANFAQQMAKDQFRWEKADANGDKKIDKVEFADFLYAHHSPRMRDAVIAEALNISDLNRDGKIDLGEYMRDLHPEYEKEKREGKKLPKWAIKEEDHFKMSLDLNKDGALSGDEIYKWTVPDDIDHTKKESNHLFEEADDNKDKHLNQDEVLKNWETFVGHKATHFGEFAPRTHHDEL